MSYTVTACETLAHTPAVAFLAKAIGGADRGGSIGCER